MSTLDVRQAQNSSNGTHNQENAGVDPGDHKNGEFDGGDVVNERPAFEKKRIE